MEGEKHYVSSRNTMGQVLVLHICEENYIQHEFLLLLVLLSSSSCWAQIIGCSDVWGKCV